MRKLAREAWAISVLNRIRILVEQGVNPIEAIDLAIENLELSMKVQVSQTTENPIYLH